MMLTALLAFCLPLLALCSPEPEEITKIVLSRTLCEPECRFAQYAFTSTGRFAYTDGATDNDLKGSFPKSQFKALATSLTHTAAFRGPADYVGTSGLPTTTIWVEASKRHWQVVLPTYDIFRSMPTRNEDIFGLTRWVDVASNEAISIVDQIREPIIQRLIRLERLRSVTFSSNGCYGSCSVFVATFHDNNEAELKSVRFVEFAKDGGTAMIAFSRVRDLLRRLGISAFSREYPPHAVDTYGITLVLHFDDGFTYEISASDSSSWPPNVAALSAAFNQLVRDISWSPKSGARVGRQR